MHDYFAPISIFGQKQANTFGVIFPRLEAPQFVPQKVG